LKIEAEIFSGYHLPNDTLMETPMHTLLNVENGTVFSLVVFHGLADYELILYFWHTDASSTYMLRCTYWITKPMQLH
jgi:hypothetical protein